MISEASGMLARQIARYVCEGLLKPAARLHIRRVEPLTPDGSSWSEQLFRTQRIDRVDHRHPECRSQCRCHINREQEQRSAQENRGIQHGNTVQEEAIRQAARYAVADLLSPGAGSVSTKHFGR